MAETTPLEGLADAADAPVIRLPVELDIATVDDLRATITQTVRAHTGPVVFDCSPLTFIDASGMGTLVWAANAAAEEGREVQLLNPGRVMRRLLLVTGLRHRFVS